MSKRTGLHPEALDELMESARWYDAQQDGVGDELTAEVVRVRKLIGESPESWPEAPDSPKRSRGLPVARQITLDRFPYRVVFAELQQLVLIVAVAHLRRRPGYWHHRLRTR